MNIIVVNPEIVDITPVRDKVIKSELRKEFQELMYDGLEIFYCYNKEKNKKIILEDNYLEIKHKTKFLEMIKNHFGKNNEIIKR
jgi:hypothetical protein